MKRLLLVLPVLAMTTGTALAADNDSHDVTVSVSAINELALSGGNITLTVDSATAGSEPDAETDATTSLAWTTNEASRKITVATDSDPSGSLKVTSAVTSGGGTDAAQVTLTTSAQDLITGFGTEVGGADLTYETSAAAADGAGDSTYTVTYTLTAV